MPFDHSQTQLSPGAILDDRYQIVSVIGSGEMGVVYQAKHQLMNRVVAIKMLRGEKAQDEKILERFIQEARAISVLSHPNIVSVYDFGISAHGQPYLVMDFLEGATLSREISTTGPLPWQRALDIFLQISSGLAHAHKNGILHRDIKPGNIILLAGEKADLVKIVDFGIARIFDPTGNTSQRLTATGELLLSPVYMSPEQCLGREVDARSDIYSFGCVMYNVLTGIAPFAGATAAETVSKHVLETPKPFSQVRPECSAPAALEQAIFKALEKDPNKRQQSMEQLTATLQSLLPECSKSTDAGLGKGSVSIDTKAKESIASAGDGGLLSRKKLIAISIAAACVLLLGGAVFFLQWKPAGTADTDVTKQLLRTAEEDARAGNWNAACRIYQQLLTSHSSKHGEHSGPVLEIRKKLAVALYQAGNRDQAIDCYNEVRGELWDLARQYDSRGKRALRLDCYMQVKNLQKELNLKDTADFDENNRRLAGAAFDSQQNDLALESLFECLAYEKKTLPPNDPALAEMKRWISKVLIGQKRYEEAKQFLLEAIPYLTDDSLTSLRSKSWAAFDLGDIYKNLKQYKEAERQWSEVAKQPDYSPFSQQACWNLANLLVEQKRYKDAEVYARKKVDCSISRQGYSESQDFLNEMDWLGDIYMHEAKVDECKKLFEKYIAALEKNGRSSYKAVDHLGLKYDKEKLYDKSEQLYTASLSTVRHMTAVERIRILIKLADTRLALNKQADSISALRESLALYDKSSIQDPALFVEIARKLATSLYRENTLEDLPKLTSRWLECADKNFGYESGEALDCLCLLMSTYYSLGKPDDAIRIGKLYLDRHRQHPLSDYRNFEIIRLLMCSYEAKGDNNEAIKYFAQLQPALKDKTISQAGRLDVLYRHQQDLTKLNRTAEAAQINKDIELIKNEPASN